MIAHYTKQGLWTTETWPDIYDRNAHLYPDKEAFVAYALAKTRPGRSGDKKIAGFDFI